MPDEATLDQWWIAIAAAVFFAKGAICVALSQRIGTQYRTAGVPPTPLAVWLIRFFAALALSSICIATVFAIFWAGMAVAWEPPYWWRWTWRSGVVVGGAVAAVTAVFVVRAMDRDARNVRLAVQSDAHRHMVATERLAEQGDALAKAGVAGRSAAATERIADTTERMTDGH